MARLFARLKRDSFVRTSFIVACMLALTTLASLQQARAATFQDQAFNNPAWQLNYYVSNPPFNYAALNGVVATPQATGGNSGGPYLEVWNYIAGATPSMPAKVVGVHLYPQSYSPQSSGAIASVAFTMDYKCESPPPMICTVNGQLFGVALRQNGKDYITHRPGTPGEPLGISSRLGVSNSTSNWSNSPPVTGWQNTATTPLTSAWTSTWQASQFCLITPATISDPTKPSASCDPSQHPDFGSSGAPIQCGFFTYDDVGYNASNPNYNYGEETKYDNWTCDLLPSQPSPASLTVAKVVSGPPVSGYTMPTFNVQVTCQHPLSGGGSVSSISNVSVQGNNQAPVNTTPPLVQGAACQFQETLPLPAPPPGCTWQQPIVYSPQSGNIALAAGSNTVTVTNTYVCSAPLTYLKVCKTYVDYTPPPGTPSPNSFPVNLKCTNFPSFPNAPWLTLNLTGAPPGNCSTNDPAGPGYSGAAATAVGTICHVQENNSATLPLFAPAPPNGGPLPLVLTPACGDNIAGAVVPGWAGWATSFNPSSRTVTVNTNNTTGNPATLTVTNALRCLPNKGRLRVVKHITTPPWPSGASFTVNVTCNYTANGVTTTVFNGTSSTLTASTPSWLVPMFMPGGTVCTITEPNVPAPFVNNSGQTCTWNPPPPPITSAPITSGPAQIISVNNSYTCAPVCPNCVPGVVPPSTIPACPKHATYDAKRRLCVCPTDRQMVNGQCQRKEGQSTQGDNSDNTDAQAPSSGGNDRPRGRRQQAPKPESSRPTESRSGN